MNAIPPKQSLAEMIEQQRLARIAKAGGKVDPAKPAIDLRGTGLNQKTLGKIQSEINRGEKAALKNQDAQREADAHVREIAEADAATMVADFTKGENIIFDDSQESALDGLLTNQFAVLIGPAGSGKTTLTKEFIARLLKIVDVKDVWFGAFTGRACQQIRRALPVTLHANVSTVHSVLEYCPAEEEYEYRDPETGRREIRTRMTFQPQRTASNPLRQKIFLFDETGMLGIQLWNKFIDACPRDARIILIGDINQLPPVMDRSVLGFAMNKWPVFELQKIHRQADGDAIIENAHRIMNGQMPQNAPNFQIFGTGIAGSPKMTDSAMHAQQTVINWIGKLAKMDKFNPIRDAFIVPQNKGEIGQIELNPHLLTMFNPPREKDGITINRRFDIHTGFDRANMAVGDKVMITSNINDITPPITNGMIGIVEEINLNGKYDQKRSQFVDTASDELNWEIDPNDASAFESDMELLADKDDDDGDNSRDQRQASHVMTIKFETGQIFQASTAGDYRKIMHSYAITCHKAQGGEYPSVVILVHSANHRMLTREWLYTAVTRARENVYIFCNNRGLTLALKNQRVKGNTLQEKIRSYNEFAESSLSAKVRMDPAKLPILWEPNKLTPEVE